MRRQSFRDVPSLSAAARKAACCAALRVPPASTAERKSPRAGNSGNAASVPSRRKREGRPNPWREYPIRVTCKRSPGRVRNGAASVNTALREARSAHLPCQPV